MKNLIGILFGLQLASVLAFGQVAQDSYQISEDGKTVLTEQIVKSVRICFEKNFPMYTPAGLEEMYDLAEGCGFKNESCPEHYQVGEGEIAIKYQSPVEEIGFCMDMDTSHLNSKRVSVTLLPTSKYTKTRPVIKGVTF